MADTVTALVQRNVNGKPAFAKERVQKPQPEAHQLLVRISHVAQNPTDVQSFDRNAAGDGSVFGCDFVGTVESVGANATRSKKDDIIAGLIRGGEKKGLGAYSEYTLADDRISFKVPPSISHEAASTVPLAAGTAWLALFSPDCLNIDRKRGNQNTVLVWGGSSSVGLYTIQIAAIYGFKIITTCSPRNFDLVKASGATYVFDYSDPDVVKKIADVEPNLRYVFDTIGNSQSSVTASQSIGKEGGGLCTVRPDKSFTDNVKEQTKVTAVLVWTAFFKEHRFGDIVWPPSKEDHELAAELFEHLPAWLEEGEIKPNVPRLKKGLDAVSEGYQDHRDGKISGYKIVYQL